MPSSIAANLVPVTGVGASAGGLEALSQLIESLPDDCGMAFLVVTHLDPRHDSLLAPILKKRRGCRLRKRQKGKLSPITFT
jgi:two-component system, chemotaxis family, CheB/CheR fusion protein